jgi:NTE family protein
LLRRGVPATDLAALSAVMASYSVPGYFKPVLVDRVPYIDGGVRSPTNADLLRSSAIDLVIVSSPMSGRELGRFGVDATIRRHAKRKLDSDRRALERAECATVILEPGPEVTTLVGHDFMSQERVVDIVGAAFLDAGAQLRTADRQRAAACRGSRRGGRLAADECSA